jgi:hypothetical protein
MRAFSHGVGSPWDADRPVKSNKQHFTMLWINTCQKSFDRHRIAMYADDMAAGADTLEELFEIYKALIIALDKAGIQIKASKVEFGVEEITFHNY